ncbi:ABC transporter permease [Actinocatenispora rupis]
MRRPKPKSAYPRPMDELLAEARTLAEEQGAIPSQNDLCRRLRIGQPKAREVLAALHRPDLHLVPADTNDTDAASGDGESATAGPDNAVSDDAPDTASQPASEPTHDTAPKPAPDDTVPAPETPPEPAEPTAAPDASAEVDTGTEPATPPNPDPAPEPANGTPRRVSTWPVIALTMPALVAIWSGWVSLGGMAGFGVVHPLPGIWDEATLNTAITLPIGVEVYAAYALWVWLSGNIPPRARRFAKWSAFASLVTGALGQVTYHLLAANHVTHAPWPIVTAVACLPVAVLGMGAALAHLVRTE